MKQAIEAGDIPAVAAKLPPFPAVVDKLLECLAEDTLSLDNLVRIARTDAVVASATLAIANQVRRNRGQHETSDLFAAASLIGTGKLQQVVVTSGMNRFLTVASGQTFFRDHSLAVAIVAHELAMLVGVSQSEAYLAGIMHDIGQLAFYVVEGEHYRELRRAAMAKGNLLELERHAYGVDHCVLGRQLGEFWHLPLSVQEAIAGHHDQDPRWHDKLHAIINLAETLAGGLDLPQSPHNRVARVSQSALELLGLRLDDPDMLDLFARSRARFFSTAWQ